MTWLVIARKEFDDAVRSRMLWGIVAIIAVMTSLTAGISMLIPQVEADPVLAIGTASQFAAMLVPIMALIAAYLSIAGERESGSLKVLLGLPPSRGEVMFGKFVGRASVVAVGLLLGFTTSGVATFLLYGSLPLVSFVLATMLTAGLGISFVGLAVGISAVTATRARAMILAISAYLGLTLLWDLLPHGIHLAVTGRTPGQFVEPWFLLVQALSPPGAYNALIRTVLYGGPAGLEVAIGGPVPNYLDPAVFVTVLVAWTLVPLLAGYRQFSRADVG